MFIIFDKINLKIQKFRQNFDDATRSERRRAIARWKALTFLQNIFADQRDRIPRRDARRTIIYQRLQLDAGDLKHVLLIFLVVPLHGQTVHFGY